MFSTYLCLIHDVSRPDRRQKALDLLLKFYRAALLNPSTSTYANTAHFFDVYASGTAELVLLPILD